MRPSREIKLQRMIVPMGILLCGCIEIRHRTIRGALPEVSDDEAEALTSVLERRAK